MEMRGDGISGVADQAEDLAAFYGVAGMDAHFSWLQVGVDGVVIFAEIEDHGVAVGLIDGNVGGVLTGRLLGQVVGDGNDFGVGDGDGFLAENCVAVRVGRGAVVDAVGVVELFPVDGVALGEPDAAVDGERGAGVAGGVAAGIGGNVIGAAERWADYDDGLGVDGDVAARFSDFLLAWRGGFGADDGRAERGGLGRFGLRAWSRE